MALITDVRRPTLEPIKRAFVDYCNTWLEQALADVTAAHEAKGDPPVRLDKPAVYEQAVIASPTVITSWPEPTLVVNGWHIRSAVPHEQRGSQEWTGTLQLTYWVQGDDADELAIALDRYGEVLWLLLISADEDKALGGAELLYENQNLLQSQPAGMTPTQRAARVEVDVMFTT